MKRLFKSFQYAFQGLRTGSKEKNFRIHLLAVIAIILLGLAIGFSPGNWIAVTICSGMVISAELFNTAIEKLMDLIHPEKNQKAGEIKDLTAAAVVVTALASVIVAAIILFNHFQ